MSRSTAAPAAPPENSMRVERIPYDKIVVGRQVRLFFGNVDELAAKIDASKWVDPLIVMPLDDGTYRLICGERRYKAIGALRKIDRNAGAPLRHAHVDAQIYEGSELGAALLNTRENLGRKDLTCYELALQIDHLMKTHGLTQTDVAHELGFSPSLISRHLSVLKLDPSILKTIERGIIPPLSDLVSWARLRPEQQKKEFQAWQGLDEQSNPTTNKGRKKKRRMVPLKKAEALLAALEAAKADKMTLASVRYLMGIREKPPLALAPDAPSGPETDG